MRASDRSTMRSTASTPSGCLRSTPIDRRPRLYTCGGGAAGSPPRTPDARSTRTTSAPKSARTMAQKGAGPIPDSSTTRRPVSGPDGGRVNDASGTGGYLQGVDRRVKTRVETPVEPRVETPGELVEALLPRGLPSLGVADERRPGDGADDGVVDESGRRAQRPFD